MDPTERARKALDLRFSRMSREDLTRPPRGWVRAIRNALGMTTVQLARRLGVSQPRITRLEQAEADDSITLKSLRQAAEAMNCTLAYALIPNDSLDEMVRRRARQIAGQELARANQTMRLEDQELSDHSLAVERRRMEDALISGPLRRLWDD